MFLSEVLLAERDGGTTGSVEIGHVGIASD